MGKGKKPADIIEFSAAGARADTRRQQDREARAKDLKQRFSAARQAAEPRSKATKRLLKIFKNPPQKP